MRHGIAASVTANIHRDPKKRKDPYKPEDFIYWHESHRQAEGLMDAKARTEKAISLMFRGLKVIRRPK